jgi:hypothetical protein
MLECSVFRSAIWSRKDFLKYEASKQGWKHLRNNELHNTDTYLGACDYRRGLDRWMNLLTTYTHHSELHFTHHWHTQSSVLSVLQFALAVSCQQLLPRKILQRPALRSSCCSCPCRTQSNSPKYSALSSQFAFTSRFLVTDLNKEDYPTYVLTSLLSCEYPATDWIAPVVFFVTLSRCSETAICLFASCIETAVLIVCSEVFV